MCGLPRRAVLAGAAGWAWAGAGRAQTVRPGRLLRFEAFPSRHVAPRTVAVWLPDGAERKRCHVLYMHDGQNLFGASEAPGGASWNIDLHLARLIGRGAVPPTIVVGVWNTPSRRAEYLPDVLDGLPAALRAEAFEKPPQSKAYVRFLADELKPWVDRRYPVRTDAPATAVMGSSMGGLISLYALCERPDVFGAAGALSMHTPLTTSPALLKAADARLGTVAQAFAEYLVATLPPPGDKRIWVDRGDRELDALYGPVQPGIAAAFAARGYRSDRDWADRLYAGTGHNEAAWDARLDDPLRYLLRRV